MPVQLGGGIRDHRDRRGLARQGHRARHHRHRGGARSRRWCEAREKFPGRSPSASTRATARSRSRAGPRPRLTAHRAGAALRGCRRRRDHLHRHRARRLLKGHQLGRRRALAEAISIPVIASGGLASIDDVRAARAARAEKLEGAITGRALYDGRLDPAEAPRADPRAARGSRLIQGRVIPCLDVKDGRVVKGVNFVDLRDAGDPVEAASAYDAAGADELCFLDITASHENRGTMLDVVRARRKPASCR
jgi:hypothetical protein